MSVLSVIGGLIKPVTSLIDELTTTDEEKQVLRNEITKMENQFSAAILDYEIKMTEMKSNVIVAEAKGDSWLQRSWRPITMLSFLAIIMLHYFGWLPEKELAPQMWTLLQIGIGGYIGGRSLEKVLPSVITAVKKAGKDNG